MRALPRRGGGRATPDHARHRNPHPRRFPLRHPRAGRAHRRDRCYLSDEGDADWKYQFAIEGPLIRERRSDRDRQRRDRRRRHARPHARAPHVPDHRRRRRRSADCRGHRRLHLRRRRRPARPARARRQHDGHDGAGAQTLWTQPQAFNAAADEWLQIWPGHGAGSACGKGISAVPHSTLGYERRFNWAFRSRRGRIRRQRARRAARSAEVLRDDEASQQAGSACAGRVHAPPRLDDRRLPALVAGPSVVVDTRSAAEYAAGHLPGSINLPFGDSFVTWAGWLLPYEADLYFIVADLAEPHLVELVRQLALIGLDRVVGVFGAEAVKVAAANGAATSQVPQMTAPSWRAAGGRTMSRSSTCGARRSGRRATSTARCTSRSAISLIAWTRFREIARWWCTARVGGDRRSPCPSSSVRAGLAS